MLAGRTNKHILIIVQNLPVPFDRRVWQEATSLRQAGYEVTVICPKKQIYTQKHERLMGIEIHRYALIMEGSQKAWGYFVEFLYCWLVTTWIAWRVYLRHPFAAIHACNPPDTYFALALLFKPFGVRFVFDHHDLSPEMYVAKGRRKGDFLFRVLLILERLTFRFADRIISVNESHRNIAIGRGRVPEEKISIVRSGPRKSWAASSSPDDSLKQGKKHLVVYLGEMCAQDGVDLLLFSIQDYLRRFPHDTHFTLIGAGPEYARLKLLAGDLGLCDFVNFTGRIPDEQLWKYLATADVCVDPDPCTEWSNLSTMNKIIEYLAFGRPIVAHDLLEHRRSAENAAVYVSGNDTVEFSKTIRQLLEDPERRCLMSHFAEQRFSEALSWERSEGELISMYRRLLQTTKE